MQGVGSGPSRRLHPGGHFRYHIEIPFLAEGRLPRFPMPTLYGSAPKRGHLLAAAFGFWSEAAPSRQDGGHAQRRGLGQCRYQPWLLAHGGPAVSERRDKSGQQVDSQTLR
jgi:hypothetical protein